jgi:hypothetical protein
VDGAAMENMFIRYIDSGKIRDHSELRHVYMKIVMKTHPDTVGSDRLVNRFLALTDQYEEAREYLSRRCSASRPGGEYGEENYRLSFFRHIRALEALDFPFNRNKDTYKRDLEHLEDRAFSCFRKWRGPDSSLYAEAQKELDTLRGEMPYGPYRKHALYLNLRPVFHNIAAFHITGLQFYRIQIKQNLAAVIERLDERQLVNLKKYMLLLIDDMENGPALHGG